MNFPLAPQTVIYTPFRPLKDASREIAGEQLCLSFATFRTLLMKDGTRVDYYDYARLTRAFNQYFQSK